MVMVFHGAVGRAAVVLTGLYYPQANRIGWQLAGMLGCKNIFTRNNLYWFIVAFSTISEPCLTRCRILLASNDIFLKKSLNFIELQVCMCLFMLLGLLMTEEKGFMICYS